MLKWVCPFLKTTTTAEITEEAISTNNSSNELKAYYAE